jgi:hypothetical protein
MQFQQKFERSEKFDETGKSLTTREHFRQCLPPSRQRPSFPLFPACSGGDGRCNNLGARRAESDRARTGRDFPIIVIQEAGLDGFWIHRVLQSEGIESHVVDAASILTAPAPAGEDRPDRWRDLGAHPDGLQAW